VLRSQVPAILDTVAAALRVYGRRTLRALLDVLSTLAGVVGPALGDPALSQRFMPQLCERWQQQGLAAPESAPVMEALTSLAIAFRDRFEPYAKPVFEAAMGVVTLMQEAKAAQVRACGARLRGLPPRNATPACLNAHAHASTAQPACAGGVAVLVAAETLPSPARRLRARPQAAGQPPPQGIKYEADTYMAALDLLAGLADALRAGAEPLISASRLVAALPEACSDEAEDVRQSGYALLGDVAR
jgi:hypothetical protein